MKVPYNQALCTVILILTAIMDDSHYILSDKADFSAVPINSFIQ